MKKLSVSRPFNTEGLLNPGLVCPLCFSLTENEADRAKHLAHFHKIEFNDHLVKFESIENRMISREHDIARVQNMLRYYSEKF